jgi:hypothetical protein
MFFWEEPRREVASGKGVSGLGKFSPRRNAAKSFLDCSGATKSRRILPAIIGARIKARRIRRLRVPCERQRGQTMRIITCAALAAPLFAAPASADSVELRCKIIGPDANYWGALQVMLIFYSCGRAARGKPLILFG